MINQKWSERMKFVGIAGLMIGAGGFAIGFSGNTILANAMVRIGALMVALAAGFFLGVWWKLH